MYLQMVACYTQIDCSEEYVMLYMIEHVVYSHYRACSLREQSS